MNLIYFWAILLFSVLLFLYSIYKDWDGLILGTSVFALVFFCISISCSIMLILNITSVEEREQNLNDLKIKAEYIIESGKYKSLNELEEETYQKLLIESINDYNKALNYCRKEQESKVYGDFMNWDFCYNYEPIEYSIAVKDITIK